MRPAVLALLALTIPAPVLAQQAVIAPAAMPLPAVEAGPAWQPRSARPLVIDAFRGGRLSNSAEPGAAAQPEHAMPSSGTGPAWSSN